MINLLNLYPQISCLLKTAYLSAPIYGLPLLSFTLSFFENDMKGFKVIDSEGTFLSWVDYRALNITEDKFKELMIKKAHIAFSLGSGYGEDGRGNWENFYE